MISSKVVISQKHLSALLPEKENTTSYTDETRKFGNVYNAYIVSDESKSPFLIGLREMADRSSSTALDTLKEILADITNALNSDGSSTSQAGATILSKVTNTMTDRAKMEVAFNELLAQYRKDSLPSLVEGWDDMNATVKEVCCKLFCGLHLLVSCAEVTAECLHKFECTVESDYLDEGNMETTTLQFLRAASKCFARGADEKSGCYIQFSSSSFTNRCHL